MPGELSNCTAGRVANVFNLRGPNFTVDAACASAMAAMDAAIDGLIERQFDVAVTGGVDRNMGVSSFVKFCAIGALSPTGTRPYADGADGFVMGEGAGLFVLKRLADAERDDDRIYAVVRGVGGASDGRGKGITAPNPVGQRLAVERAWRSSGLSPAQCTLMEGHGTSTRVGDVVEVSSLMEAFSGAGLEPGSIALGSVKSNIGHLKAGAGAAGLLKATLALHHKVLPPSVNFERPNPNLDWSRSPFAVNTELRDWEVPAGQTRVAGVSAFGFGGTNFHIVMEEHVPGHLTTNGKRASIAVPAPAAPSPPPEAGAGRAPSAKPPLRGALVLGADDEAALANELRTALAEARQGRHLDPAAPSAAALRAPERIAIDYADGDDLAAKATAALSALQAGNPAAWPALRGRGIFRGSGPAAGKVAFLFTGQGSQYANMLAELREREPVGRRAVRRGRRDHVARCWRAGGCRTSSSPIPPTPRRWRGPRRICGRPRSPSPRCSPSTWRSRACWASTGSLPTSSWATRWASTARSWPPAPSRSRPRSRRSAPAGARWRASTSRTPGRWPP